MPHNDYWHGSSPTAVVCANDRLAVGVVDALRRAGVDVPGEISVTGYDDSMLARLGHIDLTTVSQKPKSRPTTRSQPSSNASTRSAPSHDLPC